MTVRETSSGAERIAAMQLRDGDIPFGDGDGLRAVNLTLAAGERLALLGPSGAGKTSLLRAIAGLDAMRAGQLLIGGVDVTAAPPERRHTVYVHQTPALFPHLSVRDNVAFPFRLRGHDRNDARARASVWLERMRLTALADRSPAHLSGGERHRTALARALAAEPTLLLLDEPFSALDPSLRADVRAETLAVLAAPDGPASITVTHDVDEAALLGERIAVLLDRRVAQCAPPQDVLNRPASIAVARLIGMPNVIRGERDGDGWWRCAIGRVPAPGAMAACDAVGWADLITIAGADEPSECAVIVALEHRGVSLVARVRVHDMELVGHVDRSAGLVAGDRVTVSLRSTAPHLLPHDNVTASAVKPHDV